MVDMASMDEKVAMFDLLRSQFTEQLKNTNHDNHADLEDREQVDAESHGMDWFCFKFN